MGWSLKWAGPGSGKGCVRLQGRAWNIVVIFLQMASAVHQSSFGQPFASADI